MKKTDITKAGLIKLQAEVSKANKVASQLNKRIKAVKEHFIGKAGIAPGDVIHKKQTKTCKCYSGIDLVLNPRDGYYVAASYQARFVGEALKK